MLDTPRLGVSCSQQVGGKGVGWCTVVCSGSLAIGKCAESTACLDCRHSACKWHCVCDQQWSEASSNLRMVGVLKLFVIVDQHLWCDCNSKVLLSVLKRNHSSSCQQDRIGWGYIAVPAYKGSLAEAKGACNQTKLNLWPLDVVEIKVYSGHQPACI
eukprot:1162008-Pelagomonas_calceolata.AAC.11